MIITEQNLLRQHNNFNLLRLVAAFLVFVSHGYTYMGLDKSEILNQITDGRYRFSSFALVIFFTTSGFLVCRSLVTSKSIWYYLIKRFLRIWPAYAVCIVLTIIFIGIPFSTLPFLSFISHPQTISFLLTNISLISTTFKLPEVFHNTGVNGSIWTIVIEVRLYLLLLVCYIITKLHFRQFLLIGLIVVWIIKLVIPNEVEYSLLNSSVAGLINLGLVFFAGACFYLYKDKIPLNITIYLILFICWISLHVWLPQYEHEAGFPFLVYTVIYIAVRWPTIPFIKADISYGVYLYASPVQKLILYTIGQQLSFIEYMLLALVITLLLATISWYLIERKALQLKYIAFSRAYPS